MRLQDQIVRMTQRALADLVRSVEAIEPDKQDWRPAEHARSALDQLREVAVVPRFHLMLLRDGHMPTGEDHAGFRQEAAKLSTVSDAIMAARNSTNDLCELIATFPDDRLEEEITLPFGGGMHVSMADVLTIHYWNMVYHHGQVNYIQTLYGDKEMH
ncbi:MAG: DinB family protein [Armatimonadetes bacterium]|nr:DinB family protein [Armatimonadota bacterium]